MNHNTKRRVANDHLAIIVAMDRNHLIGKDNRLPWHIPEDLAYFRKVTLDHNVIIGKNTWLSLGKPLDRRTNIVLSRDPDFHPRGCIVCHDIRDVLSIVNEQTSFIIGGASVFQQFVPLVGKLYLTRIEAVFEGDVYFPDLDLNQWTLLSYETQTARSGFTLAFETYIRN
ncbi:MAG: dihydrofolate reductase [Candidatus Cloacimonetes bacterium]|nr:dihydrofolate reductase [Candidatus Cloacimonadota bacterium]